MIAYTWAFAMRFMSLFARRPRTVRWVCACGYRKREQAVRTERRGRCPYCRREIEAEVLR